MEVVKNKPLEKKINWLLSKNDSLQTVIVPHPLSPVTVLSRGLIPNVVQ